ncbi:MAG: PAS domain S-box protein [SAR324 cluster bacterium]|nr:PAS domain S-box protein [SAR324 cluster bacterium]
MTVPQIKYQQLIEELEKVRKQLREFEEKADLDQYILKHITTGVSVFNQEGIILYSNPKAENMFGYEPGELQGKHVRELRAPGRYAETQGENSILSILIKKGEWSGEIHNRKKDGTLFWTRGNFVSVEHSSFGPVFFAVQDEITELKKAEQRLKSSEKKLQEAQRVAKLGHYVFHLKTNIWTSSKELDAIFGIDEKYQRDLAGWLHIVHPEFKESLSSYLTENIINKRQKFDKEYKIICPATGEEKWVHGLGDLKTDENNELTEMFGTIQDISKRKQTEDLLEESEKKYRILFEDSRDTIYITSRDGQFIDINQAGLDLFGYSRDEMLNLNVSEIYFKADGRIRFQKKIEREGFVKDYAVKFRRKDKTALQCLLTTSLRRSKTGTIEGYQGIIRDVTEYKELETQLRQSQKLESMGVLAGGIAHEFNNLLAPILGYAAMLIENHPKENSEREDLEQIYEAGQRAASLVQQILTFSRKSMSERKRVQLEDLVQDAVKFLSQTIPSTIAVKQEIETGLTEILAAPHEIQQVIINLCLNASHAMPEGGELKIRLENGKPRQCENFYGKAIEGSFVTLSVEDSGHGISQRTLEHIFEPFFTTKEVGKGTGLGLSVVLGIVEQHGGHISVESKVKTEKHSGRTKFDVCLPVLEHQEESISDSKKQTQLFGNERILLIDDEAMLKDVLSKILKKLGYRVTAFLDCLDALECFKNNPQDFDLVITDYTMPLMTGRDVAKQIKQIRTDIPVILMTGFSEVVTTENVQLWDINALLMKPAQIGELSQLVRKLLEQSNLKKED